METATQKPSNLGKQWVLATTLGYSIVNLLLAFGLIDNIEHYFYEKSIEITGNVSGFLGIEGIIIGLAQAIVLRKLFSIRWWFLASAVGWVLGYLLALFVRKELPNDEALAFFIGIGLIGLIFGFFQSLILREKFSRAYWWIVPNIIGLYLAIAPWEWVYLSMGDANWQGPASYFYLFCYWWFPSLVVGIITGIGLVWILRGPVKDEMGTEAAVV